MSTCVETPLQFMIIFMHIYNVMFAYIRYVQIFVINKKFCVNFYANSIVFAYQELNSCQNLSSLALIVNIFSFVSFDKGIVIIKKKEYNLRPIHNICIKNCI